MVLKVHGIGCKMTDIVISEGRRGKISKSCDA